MVSLGEGKAERMAINCGTTVIIISVAIPLIVTLLISFIYRKRQKYWLTVGGATGFISGFITLYWFMSIKDTMWIEDGTECPPLDINAYLPVLLIPLIIMVAFEIILLRYISNISEA